jgi:hypothetical protein
MTIVFIPALIAILVAKERETGRALTQQEVMSIRDEATAINFRTVPVRSCRNRRITKGMGRCKLKKKLAVYDFQVQPIDFKLIYFVEKPKFGWKNSSV